MGPSLITVVEVLLLVATDSFSFLRQLPWFLWLCLTGSLALLKLLTRKAGTTLAAKRDNGSKQAQEATVYNSSAKTSANFATTLVDFTMRSASQKLTAKNAAKESTKKEDHDAANEGEAKSSTASVERNETSRQNLDRTADTVADIPSRSQQTVRASGFNIRRPDNPNI